MKTGKWIELWDKENNRLLRWDRVSTETWLKTHEVKRRCKDILLGVVSVVCMGIMGLSVIIMLFK